MTNKIASEKQYWIFIDLLNALFHKYGKNKFYVTVSSVSRFRFKLWGSVFPHEVDLSDTLDRLKEEGLIDFQRNGSSEGEVNLKPAFFEKFNEMLRRFPIMEENKSNVTYNVNANNATFGNNSPITTNNIVNSFNEIIQQIDNSKIENKEEVKQKVRDLEEEVKKPTWDITKIKSILKGLANNAGLILPLVKIILAKLGISLS